MSFLSVSVPCLYCSKASAYLRGWESLGKCSFIWEDSRENKATHTRQKCSSERWQVVHTAAHTSGTLLRLKPPKPSSHLSYLTERKDTWSLCRSWRRIPTSPHCTCLELPHKKFRAMQHTSGSSQTLRDTCWSPLDHWWAEPACTAIHHCR